MRSRLREILVAHDTEPTEIGMSFLALLWGTWLLLPWETYSASQAWRLLSALAPEWVWGVLFVSLGVAQFIICVWHTNGLSKYAAMIGCGMWTFIATGFVLANPTATGPMVYLLVAVANGWIYLRHCGALR